MSGIVPGLPVKYFIDKLRKQKVSRWEIWLRQQKVIWGKRNSSSSTTSDQQLQERTGHAQDTVGISLVKCSVSRRLNIKVISCMSHFICDTNIIYAVGVYVWWKCRGLGGLRSNGPAVKHSCKMQMKPLNAKRRQAENDTSCDRQNVMRAAAAQRVYEIEFLHELISGPGAVIISEQRIIRNV